MTRPRHPGDMNWQTPAGLRESGMALILAVIQKPGRVLTWAIYCLMATGCHTEASGDRQKMMPVTADASPTIGILLDAPDEAVQMNDAMDMMLAQDATASSGLTPRETEQEPAPTPMDTGVLPDAMVCNGFAELCDRPFHQVAYLTTHNAMSSAARNWLFPNQTHAVPRQLADGVRGLMLDLYEEDGVLLLCHGDCRAGRQTLADGLVEIRTFLEGAPSNVITLIFESYVDPEALRLALDAAGLSDEIFNRAIDGAWPTLAQMIDRRTRLVILSDVRPVRPTAGIMYVWDVAWETDYAAEELSDFSCDVNRGAVANPLFIFNHFLTKPVA
ncbi:MAG: hypothetical protein VX589_19675, partial [Myxococcota bacterium]|nr:hypothetical protein [Myxococcota bacterium]